MRKEEAMHVQLFDLDAPKKPANLSINSDLLRQAKESHINLSQALEQHLTELLREEKRKQWLKENREAIAAYNRRIAANGVFADDLRRF